VRRVLTPKWLLADVAVLIAILVMLRLGLWQWDRAQSPTGGIQNYAYAFQWPLFAVFTIVVWVKTLIEETRRDPQAPRAPRAQALPPAGAGVRRQPGTAGAPGVRVGVATAVTIDDDDDETREWNQRLAALNAASAAVEARRSGR
jgi:uncharacterized membrane protein